MKTKKPLKISKKGKQFADGIINNPKASGTEIAVQTFNVSNRNSARAIAAEYLAKPSVITYLDEHLSMAKGRIVDLVSSNREEIALKASQDILDRNLGKAVQRAEVKSEVVQVNIDLTGE